MTNITALLVSSFPCLLLLLTCTTSAYKIAMVPKFTSAVGFYGLAHEGCQNAASDISLVHECIYDGVFDADVQGSVDVLNQLIDDPTVDGISVAVLDDEAYRPVIDRGIASGKPIITFDSDAPQSKRLAYVGTDNYAMGRELSKLLQQIKPDGGTYGILTGIGPNLPLRVQGVRDFLADTEWKEVANSPKNGLLDPQYSIDKMWEIIEENPGLNAIVAVVGLPMFMDNTTNWKHFVDSNRNILTIIADTLPVQMDLMQTSYVDALVGQLPYNMGVQSAQTLIKVLDILQEGGSLDEVGLTDSIYGTHQLEVLRIPLQLPPLDFNYNYIGNVAIVGYVLCGMVVALSVGCMAWIWNYRKHQVVIISQPIFLAMIPIGSILMASAMIPLSIDDEISQRAADVACMCSPWLINIGFVVVFSALFSKTWRLNKILLTKGRFKRIVVTATDVILPCAVLLSINIVALTCWTAIAPLRFVRTLEDGTDPWNRPIGSYGQCQSTSGAKGKSIPYIVVTSVTNMTALLVANYQSYRARNVETVFNESSYVAAANASFLEAILICIPIIFLMRDNPTAYFVVLSVVLFILSFAILLFIFIPKMIAVRRQPENGKRLTKLSSHMVNSKAFSFESDVEMMESALDQYQKLSWKDKTSFLQKVGAVSAPFAAAPAGEPEAVANGRNCLSDVMTESKLSSVAKDACQTIMTESLRSG